MIELPPLSVDEERLVEAIRGHEHLHESDVRDYLLFVRAKREVIDAVAKEGYPTWPETGEESDNES